MKTCELCQYMVCEVKPYGYEVPKRPYTEVITLYRLESQCYLEREPTRRCWNEPACRHYVDCGLRKVNPIEDWLI